MIRFIHVVALTCAIALMGGAAQARDVVIFAAASLKNALDAALTEHSQTPVVVSYAGSSALARQISLGAPADIFISANLAWMDQLEAEGAIVPSSRVTLVRNTLVLVGTEEGALELTLPALQSALGGTGRIAMALVDAVPAGIYGKAALENLGLWPDLAGRVAQTDNVRSALRLVSLGEAPLGIVYETDARADPNVVIRARFAAQVHPDIAYPIALVSGRAHPDAADLIRFLVSPPAQSIFAQHGFLPGAAP